MLRTLILLCTVLALAAPAAADQITLTNGDRITGTVVSLDANLLALTTPHGELRIPWADVTALLVDDPILVTVGAAAPVEVRIAAADTAGSVTLDPGGPVELDQIAALSRPVPAVSIEGGANAGVISTGGNTDINSLRLDGDITVRQLANRYAGTAAINYAEDAGDEKADNWNTTFNYDRFFTDRLFLNANAILTNDKFRDLDLRTALGVAVGYQVLNTPFVRLTANGGFGWVNEDFNAGVNDDYTAARESTAIDVFILSSRVQFFHQHDGYFGVTGDDNLFVKMKNGVRIGLIGGLVTTVQHDLDYDRSPAGDRNNTDRTFALTFGYRF